MDNFGLSFPPGLKPYPPPLFKEGKCSVDVLSATRDAASYVRLAVVSVGLVDGVPANSLPDRLLIAPELVVALKKLEFVVLGYFEGEFECC